MRFLDGNFKREQNGEFAANEWGKYPIVEHPQYPEWWVILIVQATCPRAAPFANTARVKLSTTKKSCYETRNRLTTILVGKDAVTHCDCASYGQIATVLHEQQRLPQGIRLDLPRQ